MPSQANVAPAADRGSISSISAGNSSAVAGGGLEAGGTAVEVGPEAEWHRSYEKLYHAFWYVVAAPTNRSHLGVSPHELGASPQADAFELVAISRLFTPPNSRLASPKIVYPTGLLMHTHHREDVRDCSHRDCSHHPSSRVYMTYGELDVLPQAWSPALGEVLASLQLPTAFAAASAEPSQPAQPYPQQPPQAQQQPQTQQQPPQPPQASLPPRQPHSAAGAQPTPGGPTLLPPPLRSVPLMLRPAEARKRRAGSRSALPNELAAAFYTSRLGAPLALPPFAAEGLAVGLPAHQTCHELGCVLGGLYLHVYVYLHLAGRD